MALLDHGMLRHEGVFVVLLVPVLVVLEAHDAAPLRLGNVPPPRRRICATVLTLDHLRAPGARPSRAGSTACHVVDVEG
ncbi:hypothetical protein BJY16_007786 [Actinoplanes octamycinicus]|uniref:Uncharacterized protein n=1 Tax=Actinoplanes octamycinicus TaxID=135948 RepID=A0A7W7H5R6_9ACTN|nr:hypothetical protein [Actinoplanes octamycinicus]